MLACLGLMVLSLLFHRPDAAPRPEAEIAAAKVWLSRAQHLSFATEREYCGYLGHGPDGTLSFSAMARGGRDGCTPEAPQANLTLVASLHSHGAYHPDVPAEFPTALDIESDAREGVNGYISTPGGRLWYIDVTALAAFQLCGPGCLPQDPDFHAGDHGLIRKFYSLHTLRRMERSD
jgi:hypothetical protein